MKTLNIKEFFITIGRLLVLAAVAGMIIYSFWHPAHEYGPVAPTSATSTWFVR